MLVLALGWQSMIVEMNPHHSCLSSQTVRSCLFVVIPILLGYHWARCPAGTEGLAETWDPVGTLQCQHAEVLCFAETWKQQVAV